MAEGEDRTQGIGEMTSQVAEPSAERDIGRPRLGDLRSHLTCVICAGYFIDATTIVECLHTFCRSCILCHLEKSSCCPVCAATIHRTKGSSSLRADRILQTLVYKMVPDLFTQEMQQRRHFYQQKPYADPELPSWAKGDVASYAPHVFTPDEHLQLRLAMFDAPDNRDEEGSPDQCSTVGVPEVEGVPPVRYLRCQAGTPLTVLHKFIRNKFQLPPSIQVQLIHGNRILPSDISLMDFGYMHQLNQESVIGLSFRLVRPLKRPFEPEPAVNEEEPALKRTKTEEQASNVCDDEDSIVSEAEQKTVSDSLRADETVKDPEKNEDETKSNTRTEATVPEVDVDTEPATEGSINEQDSGIFEPIGDERSCSEPEVEDEEMTNADKSDDEKDPAAPSLEINETVSEPAHQQARKLPELKVVLKEIDLNRLQSGVEREQTKSTSTSVGSSNNDQDTDSGREETGYKETEMKVDEKGKDVDLVESGSKSESAVIPEPEDKVPRRPSMLERMFDPDDEEPTSPQIVEDIIASLDAEDAEDIVPIPTVAALSPVPGGSPVSLSPLSPHPVTVAIPRPGSHRQVTPISPLARLPTPTQAPDLPKSMATGDSDSPLLSVNPPNESARTDAPKQVAALSDPGSNGIRQDNTAAGVGPASENKERISASAESSADKSQDDVDRKAAKASDKDDLPRSASSSSTDSNSSRKTSPSDTVPTEKSQCSSVVPNNQNQTIVPSPGICSSDDERTSRATYQVASTSATTNGSNVVKTPIPLKIVINKTASPSLKSPSHAEKTRDPQKNASSQTGSMSDPGKERQTRTISENHVSRKEQATSPTSIGISATVDEAGPTMKDSGTATATRPSVLKTIPARTAAPTERQNIETAGSPKPASTVHETSVVKLHNARPANGSCPKPSDRPDDGDKSSSSAIRTGVLTATASAIRGISAIATALHEGEVAIERVPNVFVQAATKKSHVFPEQTKESSPPKTASSTACLKVDCSVQTMPVAKTSDDVNVEVPKSVPPAPPKMVDTGTATAELLQSKRPASVPHSILSEGKEQASSKRRVSVGDHHVRRPSLSTAHTKIPSIGDIRSKNLSSSEQQCVKPLDGQHFHSNSSSDKGHSSATPRNPSAEMSGFGKESVEHSHPKLVGSVPRPSEIPMTTAGQNRVAPEKMHPTDEPTSEPHCTPSVLKVPQISRADVNKLDVKVNKPDVKASPKKKRIRSKKAYEKELNLSYTLWKSLKELKKAAEPLDLSTHIRNTVAPDSTSMLAKTPSPPLKPKPTWPKAAKAQGTQTIHSIVSSLASRQQISLTPITSMAGSSHTPVSRSRAPTPRPPSPYLSSHLPMPMPYPMPEYSFAPGGFYNPQLHVNTSMASRLSYDMAMRNLLTLSHMAMAQGGMVRPPHHMFPMQHMFPPRPKSHDFHPIPDPSLLRQQSEAARMGASAKKASPTAGTTAPQLRSPTALTSASIQHMEDLTRIVGKRANGDRHSVTFTSLHSGD